MDLARKNLYYYRFLQRLAQALLVSGLALVLMLLLGLFYSTDGILVDIVWTVHIFAHLFAVGSAFGLLSQMGVCLPRPAKYGFFALVLTVVGIIVGMSLMPIVSRDALIYHLAVPKWWLEQGRIFEIDWHEWSHFPLLQSISYMGFLAHGFDQVIPAFHGSYLFIAAAIVAGFLHYKFQKEDLSLLGAVLVMTTPICLRLAGEPMVDLVLAVYFGAAFSWFVFWGDQHGPRRDLVWIGVLLGLGLSVKYNSFLALAMFLLTMVSFLQQWKRGIGESLKIMAVLAGVAILTVSPWLLKNFIFTGNPLYPFAGGLFGGVSSAPFQGKVSILTHRLGGYGENWWDLLLTPWRMMVAGADDQPSRFDGLLSPLYLIAVVPLFGIKERDRWVGSTWLFLFGYFTTSLLLFYPLVRYQAPLLIPAAVLTAAGVGRLGSFRAERFRSLLIYLLATLQICFAGWYVFNRGEKIEVWSYLSSAETREAYLERRIDEFRVAKYVNEVLPKEASLYLMYTGNRFYYFDRRVRGSYFSHAPILEALGTPPSALALKTWMSQQGITHLAIHNARTKEALENAMDGEEKQAWSEFVKVSLELVGQVGGRPQDGAPGPVTIWKLRN